MGGKFPWLSLLSGELSLLLGLSCTVDGNIHIKSIVSRIRRVRKLLSRIIMTMGRELVKPIRRREETLSRNWLR